MSFGYKISPNHDSNMKDPVGLVLGVLFVVCGAYFIVQREHLVKPESPNRENKVKKILVMGLGILLIGIGLVAVRLLE